MKKKLLPLFLLFTISFFAQRSLAQLVVTASAGAESLAKKLVGEGVTISNVTFTGDRTMAGFFVNRGGTNIGLDSGIILTNGRAKTTGAGTWGADGNGSIMAGSITADKSWNFPGDSDLSTEIGGTTGDACVLEFDFVPLGDSIKFRYVFSSEEYNPQYVCSFNDAFAFFISGPGFTGLKNIALLPNTTTPVSIFNVNDIPDGEGPGGNNCVNNPAYYLDNTTNKYFTHDGHTVVLTALARVSPCQVYHLKLVIADAGTDKAFDSGVFLESGSLTSNAFQLTNLTQVDPVTGLSYLVEGCATGALKIKRPKPSPFPQTVNLAYGGSAINGVDVQTLPSSILIPANATEVLLNILPIMDLTPEGIETLKIYTLAPCAVGAPQPTDSALIQIRDYDILGITPDTVNICRNTSVQLVASSGYTTYTWNANTTLSDDAIANPIATPTSGRTMYYCTASVGTCSAKDSAFVRWKDIDFLSKKEINCKNANTGQIRVDAGAEWVSPVQYSINTGAFQTDGTFNNLPVGNYIVKVKDAAGCIDSIAVPLTQLFPDLDASSVPVSATCSGNADGKITITSVGGKAPYQYSINNGANFQSSNIFNVRQGTYQLMVKDNNGCTFAKQETVLLNDDLTVDAGSEATICEGSKIKLASISNGTVFTWSPAIFLTAGNTATPTVAPVVTTKYFVTAKKGICTKIDSVIVNVDAAPKANAGSDITICFGASTNLAGSGGTEFTWSPATYLTSNTAADTKVNKPLENITYYLHVKDAKGCPSLKADTVKVKVTPVVKIFAGRDTMVAFNQPLRLRAVEVSNSGVTSYTWSPSYGLNNPDIASPVARLDRDMTYTVTGKTPNDCEGSDQVFVKAYKGPEIYVPTAFTPNGDQRNDLLRATAIGMKEYHFFTIYNRWGQVIFTTKDFTNGWDGRVQGMLQNPGTYIWIAEAVDFRGNLVKRNGSTILLR